MQVKMTKSAYQLVQEGSLGCGTETGGLVYGTLKSPIILKASKAGNLANVSAVSYSNDPEYDNDCLHETMEAYGGKAKLVGYWHKHPGSMSRPSSTDRATARGIVGRIETEGDKRPVFFIITNVINGQVKMYCYALDDRKEFVPVEIRVIEDDSMEIEEALSLEPAIVLPKTMDFWNDAGFQFYLTRAGNERLHADVKELRAMGYSVKAYSKGQLYLVIKKNDETLTCLPPAEYPLNPPRFFDGKDEIKYSMPFWNSSFKMIDIVRDLNKSKTTERRTHESHCNETSPGLHRVIYEIKRAVKSLWPCKER